MLPMPMTQTWRKPMTETLEERVAQLIKKAASEFRRFDYGDVAEAHHVERVRGMLK